MAQHGIDTQSVPAGDSAGSVRAITSAGSTEGFGVGPQGGQGERSLKSHDQSPQDAAHPAPHTYGPQRLFRNSHGMLCMLASNLTVIGVKLDSDWRQT